MQRISKTKFVTEEHIKFKELGIEHLPKLFICPKCNKIMCVSNSGVSGATRYDGHHRHLDRCKPQIYIMRWANYMAISGYSNSRMPFWLWKL